LHVIINQSTSIYKIMINIKKLLRLDEADKLYARLGKVFDANLDTVIWAVVREWLAEANVYVSRYIPQPCRRLSVSLCMYFC